MTLKIPSYSFKKANLSCTDTSSFALLAFPVTFAIMKMFTILKTDYIFGQEKSHTVNLLETDEPELRCVSTLNNNEADPVCGQPT